MPRTRKPKPTDVPEEILDHFAGPARPMLPVEVDAITKRFNKAMVERRLGGELTRHLGYPPGGEKPPDTSNQRKGSNGGMKVFTDLKTCGCQDILIAVTDGLKGMCAALAAIHTATPLQTCIVHLLRHRLDFANWKERKPLGAALRPVYTAASAEAAALGAFEQGPLGRRFPTVVASWRRAWSHVIPFFALRYITARWGKAANHWHLAMNHFAILYEDRLTRPLA